MSYSRTNEISPIAQDWLLKKFEKPEHLCPKVSFKIANLVDEFQLHAKNNKKAPIQNQCSDS